MTSDSHMHSLYGWYPTHGGETQHRREHRITIDWLREHLPTSCRAGWISLMNTAWTKQTPKDVLQRISKHDTSELVELLYPRKPEMFHTARKYTLSYELFANDYDGPFPQDLLQQCVQAREGCLSATCLFALTGAVGCLGTMLDYGADPNGLESPDSWSYIKLPNYRILPVTPMDCALLSDNEDCQMVLEMFGGRMLQEQLS